MDNLAHLCDSVDDNKISYLFLSDHSHLVTLPQLLLTGRVRYVWHKCRGGQACTLQWSHLCIQNSCKIATKICQFSKYLGTRLDVLFEIAKSVEIVIIWKKQFYPKILNFMQQILLCCYLCPHKFIKKANLFYKLA